jgi:sec-independent protein translocase protein TatA
MKLRPSHFVVALTLALLLPSCVGGLGALELGIIAFIVLLLFGVKRLPELMGGMGSGIRMLKKNLNEDDASDADDDTAADDSESKSDED